MPIKKKDILQNEVRRTILNILRKQDMSVYEMCRELDKVHARQGRGGHVPRSRGFSHTNVRTQTKILLKNGLIKIKDSRASSKSSQLKIVYGV